MCFGLSGLGVKQPNISSELLLIIKAEAAVGRVSPLTIHHALVLNRLRIPKNQILKQTSGERLALIEPVAPAVT